MATTRLHHELARRRLSYRAAGDLVGCTHTTVERWCKGRAEPYPRHRRKLEGIFGMPVAELLAVQNDDGAAAQSDDPTS